MNLEAIVNNMISANEPESNIAMVIKTFKQVRDSKKKKSPLKQIENTECPEGQEKDQFGNCVPISKPGQSIIQKGSRPISSAEKAAMDEFDRKKLGGELDEVVVTAEAPKPTKDKDIQKTKELIGSAPQDDDSEEELDFELLFGGLKGVDRNKGKNLGVEFGVDLNKTKNKLTNTLIQNDPFFNTFAQRVQEGSQNVIQQKKQEIEKRLNINSTQSEIDAANKELNTFIEELIRNTGKNSSIFQDKIKNYQEAVSVEIDKRDEERRINEYGEGLTGKAMETIKVTFPKAIQEFGLLNNSANIAALNKEKQKVLNQADGSMVRYGGRVSPKTGVYLGGKIATKEEALLDINNDIKRLSKDALTNILKSEEYGRELSKFKTNEIFDKDGLTWEDFKGLLGTQGIQMLSAIVTLGGSTGIQEGGAAYKEIATKLAANKLGLTEENFNLLPEDQKANAILEIVQNNPKGLDEAFGVAFGTTLLDAIGIGKVIGVAKKAVPKGFIKAVLRKDLETASKQIASGGKELLGAQTIESLTETGQQVVSRTGVAAGTDESITEAVFSDPKGYAEEFMAAFITTGPMIGGGKAVRTAIGNTFNAISDAASPDSASNVMDMLIKESESTYNIEKNKLYEQYAKGQISKLQRDEGIANLNNNINETLENLDAAKTVINDTKFRELDGEKKKIVFEEIVNKNKADQKIQEISEQIDIAKDNNTTTVDLDIALEEQQNISQKAYDNAIKQRALDIMDKDGNAIADYINNQTEGDFADKKINIFETVKEAENYIKENFNDQLNNAEVKTLLKGGRGSNNGIKVGNEGIIVKENIEANLDEGDLTGANTVNHEALHLILDNSTFTDLNNLKKDIITEVGKSKDPKMTKALEFAQDRVKQYSKDGVKGKALVEEFFTGLSDGLRDIEIKDISLEDGKILKSIGNKFTSLFGKNTPGLDFNNLTAVNTLQFIKKFNNFNSKTGPLSTIKGKATVDIDEVRAQKPLTSEEINEQVKDIEKGKMTDEFAVQVAYAYEPLAQTIAKGIYRNYPEFKEQGYTQNDFVDDITFGDPKEIGGTNSLMEIAKQYDPNNPEGKSLGGWLKDIGTQRAKRIADVRIGKQRTTAAQTTETKESQQVADKPAPEITLDKPTTKALALPKELEEKVTDNITELAVLNIGAQLKKSPKATPKQKTTIKEKAASSIVNREVGKDVKRVIKNLGVDAANDYISKNYRAVAEAFVKDKNINKIRDAKTKELLQGWKDGNITKESVTGYFNDPNVKSNTRSDRRNRALNDVIVYNLTRDAVNKYVAKNPEASQKSIEDTGIDLVLASKPSYNIKTKTGTRKFAKEIIEMTKSPEYKPGLFNVSMFSDGNKLFYPGFRSAMTGIISKDNFGKQTKDFSKTKASQTIGGSIKTIKEKDKKAGETIEQRVAKFNNQKQILFDETIDFLSKMAKVDNGKYETTISHMLQIAGEERNSWLSVGAQIYSYDPNAKGPITWEHAVPVKYAAQVILDALFKPSRFKGKTFEEVITALKRNYKQVGFDKATLDAAKLAKHTMPQGWDLFDDSWTARYENVKDQLNLSDQKVLLEGNQQNVFKGTLSEEFNKMIERTKGVKAEAIYSDTRAKKLGEKRGFQAFVPYSAEDFLGLIYPTLEKGKQGDKDLQWWKDNVMNPYNDGMTAFETAKQAAMLEWKQIQDKVQNTPTNLNKEAVRGFTNQDAVRVYLWNEQDVLPDNKDLASKDVKALVDHVNNNAELKKFADELQKLSPQGYPAPTPGWNAGTITTDLVNFVNTETRNQYLQPYFEAVDAIFTPDNLNKLRAQYGNRYVEALEDTLYRMKTGRNRPSGANRQTNLWLNWVNDSVGTIMFFNMRSALLQTISSVNFINWSDNNPARAAAAFANQKQYWKDFSTLFNSDFLKQRRSGLKTDVNADEIAASAAASTNKVRAGISYLLKKGFLPTQIADSFAIASGGSTFYRNRIKALQKEGLSTAEAEKQAFAEFRTLANESQQSSDPSRISMEQASPLGRVILAFANTPIQYTRLTKRAIQDLRNGRGDWKTNVSKIVYYGIAQNIIFTALQQAMFGMLFTDDDDLEDLGPKEKKFREDQKSKSRFNILNSTADMFLRGSGVMGAFVAMFKNLGLEIKRQLDKPSRRDFEKVADKIWTFSPALDSKFKKLQSAGRTFTYKQELEKIRTRGFALNNPALDAALKVISAFANIPADRVLRKLNHIVESTDSRNAIWQRIALAMGWGEWELGIQARKQDEEKALSDSFKALDKSIGRAVKKRKKEEEKEKKKKSPIKDLQKGVLGRANRDGSIEVAAGLSPAKKKEVIAHEKRHQQEMKSGKLDYDDNFVYYGKKKFERKNGQIAHGGKWKPEGDHSLPWEKFAHNYKRK